MQLHHNIIIANDKEKERPIRTGVKYIDWPITEHTGWSTLIITCNNVGDKRDGVSGGERHGPLVMLQWTCCLHSAHAAASLVYSRAFCCHPGMKEIKQDAAVPRGSFHIASCLPVEASQPYATNMDSGLCSLLKARR